MRALEVQLHVVLPGDGDTAVKLDALRRNSREGLRTVGSCNACGGVSIRRRCREICCCPCSLDEYVKIGHSVFECLETADGTCELHPRLGVLDGELQAPRGSPDLFASKENHAPIDRLFQYG